MTPGPDVSGFTRSERYIMESLSSLQGAVVELRDRVAKIEARIDATEGTPKSSPDSNHKIIEGRTQIWLAVVGGIFTLLSSITALVLTLLAK